MCCRRTSDLKRSCLCSREELIGIEDVSTRYEGCGGMAVTCDVPDPQYPTGGGFDAQKEFNECRFRVWLGKVGHRRVRKAERWVQKFVEFVWGPYEVQLYHNAIYCYLFREMRCSDGGSCL